MVGGMEWIILLGAIVLLLFGAKKIPELAKGLGRARGEYERGKREVQQEMADMEAERKSKSKKSKKSAGSEGRIIKAARDLGIETEGKSETELKKEIQTKVQTI